MILNLQPSVFELQYALQKYPSMIHGQTHHSPLAQELDRFEIGAEFYRARKGVKESFYVPPGCLHLLATYSEYLYSGWQRQPSEVPATQESRCQAFVDLGRFEKWSRGLAGHFLQSGSKPLLESPPDSVRAAEGLPFKLIEGSPSTDRKQ